MAKLLPSIRVAGVEYRVLRLEGGGRGPRFLLRNAAGDLFGLFPYNAQPSRLYAVHLVADRRGENALERVEFFDSSRELEIGITRSSPVLRSRS